MVHAGIKISIAAENNHTNPLIWIKISELGFFDGKLNCLLQIGILILYNLPPHLYGIINIHRIKKENDKKRDSTGFSANYPVLF